MSHELPTLWWREGDAFVAHAGRFVGVRWTGVPTVDQLAALADAHRAACAQPEEVIVVDDVARLDGPVRIESGLYEQLCRLIESGRARTRAVAHVIEVPGAAGTIVRSFLRGIEHVAGDGRAKTATFDQVETALAWLGGAAPDDDRTRALVSTWRAMERAAAHSLAA